jgi:quercetin dioxygenase-like cupin family protein
MTVAMFVFDKGAKMPQHVAEGVVMVQVLHGRLRMSAEGQEHRLSTGQVLMLAPSVTHDVQADEPTEMLLTVSLQNSPASS